MAIKNNKSNETKKKKPFLVAGLILLAFVLASVLTLVLVGPSLLSPAMFLRNVAILMGAGGAGVGLASLVVKGINRLINGDSKEKSNKRDKELNRERTQEQELEQEREEEQTISLAPEVKTVRTAPKTKVVEEVEDVDLNFEEEKREVKKPVTRKGR